MVARGFAHVILALVVLFSSMTMIPPTSEAAVNLPDDHDFEFPAPVTGPRDLLTILVEFSDQKHTHPAINVSREMFGPRPSMNDYWNETSFNNFYFTNKGVWKWIEMWDDPDTKGDNATLYDESTLAYWENLKDIGAGKYRWWACLSLDKVGFDFTQFDDNNDGTVSLDSEVGLQVVDSRPGGGGASRSLTDNAGGAIDWDVTWSELVLDGKYIVGNGAVTHGGEISGKHIGYIFAHEIGHATLGLKDLYGNGTNPESIHMFSLYCDYGGPHHLDAYQKINMGWIQPTVVTKDGWYDIKDAGTNAEAYILHEPYHGTDEYFIVENRWMGTSYDSTTQFAHNNDPDSDLIDEGLVVWHVDETRPWSTDGVNNTISRLQLVTRDGDHWDRVEDDVEKNYVESAFNGEDDDYYDFNDESSPRNSRWWDNTTSGVGMYGVSESKQTMKAYFDIPGSTGIYADTKEFYAQAPWGETVEFSFNIYNTGDETHDVGIMVQGLGSDILVTHSHDRFDLYGGWMEIYDFTMTKLGSMPCDEMPDLREFSVVIQSYTNRMFKQTINGVFNLSGSKPEIMVQPDPIEKFPGERATFNFKYRNVGSDLATFTFSIKGIYDSTHNAYPKHIEDSWMIKISGPRYPVWSCGQSYTNGICTLQIPKSWAGAVDTTYEFDIIVTTDEGYQDSGRGYLTVKATMDSLMRYQMMRMLETAQDSMHKSMAAKLRGTAEKMQLAALKYQLDEPLVSKNLLKAAQNKLDAYILEVDARAGKTIGYKQANFMTNEALAFKSEIQSISDQLPNKLKPGGPGGPGKL